MIWLFIIGIAFYLVFLYWFIKRRYLPRWIVPSNRKDGRERYKLAMTLRVILTILHTVTFFLVLLWFPITLFVLLFPSELPDITFYTSYFVDLSQIPGVDPDRLLFNSFSGTTPLEMPAPNKLIFMFFALTNLIKLVLTVTVLRLLRNIFASYTNGEPFSSGNSRRLETIGKILIAAYVAAPFWYLFLSGSVINLILIRMESVRLTTGTSFNLMGVLIGIALLVLSGIIKQAERVEEEQRLTI